ncbi:hypothetical protein HN51_051858 [Arachis hypogaea]
MEFWKQLCLKHGISKDRILEDFATQFGLGYVTTYLCNVEVVTGKMCSSIRLMISITYHELCSSTWSLELLMAFKIVTTLISTTMRTSVLDHGGGAGNNWASGYHQGTNVEEDIMDMIDREADGSDSLEGFVLCHSIAGGTGSGMGSYLLETLNDRYSKKLVQTYSVFPNQMETSDVVVQPYNSLLTLK